MIGRAMHSCKKAIKKPHPVKGRADVSGVLLEDGLEGEDLLDDELVAVIASSDVALLVWFARPGICLSSE